MQQFDTMPESDRYEFLLSALKDSVRKETEKGFLFAIAAQLRGLSEDALDRSCVEMVFQAKRL